jgi:uncharacterized delta-60 repeat protein
MCYRFASLVSVALLACGDDSTPASADLTDTDGGGDLAETNPDSSGASESFLDATPRAPVSLAPGALDPAYGVDGVVRLAMDWSPSGVVSLPDGGVLIYGFKETEADTERGQIVRLTHTGEVHPYFGTNGLAELPLDASPYAALITPDDMLIVAGSYPHDGVGQAGLWRLRPDGSLDVEFNQRAAGLTELGQYATALAVDAGGALRVLLLDNFAFTSTTVRLGADGTPDATFGGGRGVVETFVVNGINGFGYPTDGGGFAVTLVKNNRSTLALLDAGGRLDTAFAESGYLLLDVWETVRDGSGRFIVPHTDGATRPPQEVAFTALLGATRGLVPRRPGGGALTVMGGEGGVHVRALDADGTFDANFGTDGTFTPARDIGTAEAPGLPALGEDATGNAIFAFASAAGQVVVVRLGR